MIDYKTAPDVRVGILTAHKIRIRLNGNFNSYDGHSVPDGELILSLHNDKIEFR